MLNELSNEIHENAVAHGWWEEERKLPEILMLCVSELSEALEEYRDHSPMEYHMCKSLIYGEREKCAIRSTACSQRNPKPEGTAVEMADCIIRILDWCGKEGIDIDGIIQRKMEYNKTRPYRHGGKQC